MTMPTTHQDGSRVSESVISTDRVVVATSQRGRAGSRLAHDGRGTQERRKRYQAQERSLGVMDKNKVSSPAKVGGERKVFGDGGVVAAGRGAAGNGVDVAVSKTVSYAQALKTTLATAENSLTNSKIGSRCQTPSDTNIPGQGRTTPPPLSDRVTPPHMDVPSPSTASESSSRGVSRRAANSPSRSSMNQEVVRLKVGKREEVVHISTALPAVPDEVIIANFRSSECMSSEMGQEMEHALRENESEDLPPPGKGEQLLVHKDRLQLSPLRQPSTPPRNPSPLGEQEENGSLQGGDTNVKPVSTTTTMREEIEEVQESKISKSEPSNLVAPVSCVVSTFQVDPLPSDGMAPGIVKTPPPPPGFHPPIHPHMMSFSKSHQILGQQKLVAAAQVAASHRQYTYPPQTLSGIVQLSSSLVSALPPAASHHLSPSLPQQVMDIDHARLAAIAHHAHSVQGPPVTFNPQTPHSRPLLSGHPPPPLTAQHLELLINYGVLQQQAIQKTLMLQQHGQQQLAKCSPDKMEVHLDKVLATNAHLQQQLQQVYHHCPPPSASSKVDAPSSRDTLNPYLMPTPHVPAHLTWSRRAVAPVYSQAIRPNAYPHLPIPQRPTLMVSAELPSSSSFPVMEYGSKQEKGQTTSDLSRGSALAGSSGNTQEREQNTESLKSSSLSIKATPFIPMGRTPGLTSTDSASSSVIPEAPCASLDHSPQARKPSFPCNPTELGTSVIGRAPSRGVEQPGHQAFLPPPNASLLYNSVPRLPHPPLTSSMVPHPPPTSSMVLMSQMMKSVTSTVAAGHRKGRETQPYTVLPGQDCSLFHAAQQLHQQLSGGGGGGNEKGSILAKEIVPPLYRYPRPSLGEVVPVSAMGLDLSGRHVHLSQKIAKPYPYAGHMAGTLHGSKPPSNDVMGGVGRATVVVGAAQCMKNMQAAASANKRALLPTPSHTPRLPHLSSVSQASWSAPLHAPVGLTTPTHTHGPGGHNAGGPMIYPPEQAMPGGAATGYAATGPVGILTAAYTRNQM